MGVGLIGMGDGERRWRSRRLRLGSLLEIITPTTNAANGVVGFPPGSDRFFPVAVVIFEHRGIRKHRR
jgi:hypothetical protein